MPLAMGENGKGTTTNLDCHLTDGTWYCDWNSGGNNMDTDFEYAMMRRGTSGWPDGTTSPADKRFALPVNEPTTDRSNCNP